MEIIDQNPRPISTTDWFITILIASIPIVGFIMLFVWAFGSETKPSKANWAKATLLWYLVGIGLFIMALSLGAFASLISMAQ
ncbi:MAG: hypothetical protein CMP59_01145 [Flavobacteriales bacterium]|nr:hypothetical protein [Flavobacteriales bacterium]